VEQTSAREGFFEMNAVDIKPLTYTIVAEQDADIAAREALLDLAMGPKRRKKSSEKIRRGRKPSEGLALVARDAAGRVVGTVRLWDAAAGILPPPLTLPLKGQGDSETSATPSPLRGGVRGGGIEEMPTLLLGPLAVDPSIKSAGIGSAMMHHAIAEATRLGHRAIILVGDASYYGRFGFSPDKTGNLAMPGPFEKHRLLALELVPGALDGACGVIRPTGRKGKDHKAEPRKLAA
jgi:predicted N-acetyltransferase YhbS